MTRWSAGRRAGRRAGLLLAAPLLAAIGAWALDRAYPPDLSRMATSGEVLDRAGGLLAARIAPGGAWRLASQPDQVSPLFIALLLRSEDRRFRWHPGVDPIALARAAGQLLIHGHVVSGGSTLAMQAARLLHPARRTPGAKLIEMARALQLEWRYGRVGVLRIWLTLAPFGGNLEGVRAGSLAWFGHEPRSLEPAEAALLAAIPRRPEAYRPDRHPMRAAGVRARLLRLGIASGMFAEGPVAPVPAARQALPRHAPQALLALGVSGQRRATTLDAGLQAAVEQVAAARLATLPPRVSLALLVADARSRQLRAIWAGAWGDANRAGSLDLTRAIRSPGSALKPFIYAEAFADGIAGPDTALADVPRQYGGYAPENLDRSFAGGITATVALQRSLNQPAVALLDRIGPMQFAESLRLAGAALHLPPRAAPALPLALGGAGISLRDLAGLYAALTTDGRAAPLVLAGTATPPRPFLAPDAAASVADILTRRTPGSVQARFAWKTGTSWDSRDAWAIGFDRSNLVAVWIGRPDGTPMPGQTGLALAVPLLDRLFDQLPADPRHPAVAAPHGLADTPQADAAALRLLFPPQGASLSAGGPVTLRAMGGQRPLTFLVDGRPLDSEAVSRNASWLPPGPGFYRVTILDAAGAAARAGVRIR